MTTTHRSKRFNPNVMTEKIVPVLLIALLAVFVIIGLSLAGFFPTA